MKWVLRLLLKTGADGERGGSATRFLALSGWEKSSAYFGVVLKPVIKNGPKWPLCPLYLFLIHIQYGDTWGEIEREQTLKVYAIIVWLVRMRSPRPLWPNVKNKVRTGPHYRFSVPFRSRKRKVDSMGSVSTAAFCDAAAPTLMIHFCFTAPKRSWKTEEKNVLVAPA